MTTFRETRGIPVVTKSSAEQIGSVKHFVVEDGHVSALHVDGGKKHGQLVSWTDIAAFGADAVVVASDEVVHEAATERENRALHDELVVLDKLVLDDDGNEHGTVSDVTFDPNEGVIESITISGGDTLDGARLRGVGSYAVVISAAD